MYACSDKKRKKNIVATTDLAKPGVIQHSLMLELYLDSCRLWVNTCVCPPVCLTGKVDKERKLYNKLSYSY